MVFIKCLKLLLVVVSNVLILVAVHQVVDVVAVDGIVVVGVHQVFDVIVNGCF